MKIEDKRNGNIISDFPEYGKHDFPGSHYGYIVTTNDMRILYFFVSYQEDSDSAYESVDFIDVTESFNIR